MDLFVDRKLKGEHAVKAHPLYGRAVFLECGYHNQEMFCYDHHDMPGSSVMLSIALQIQTELIQRRKLPIAVVCNHVRHYDNLLSMYMLRYRSMAKHPDTLLLVAAADLIDRVGPLAVSSVPQLIASVLLTAQEIVPFKEFDLTAYTDEQIRDFALKALESLRGMVAREVKAARYEQMYRSSDQLFAIVKSEDFIGNTLYDEGCDAYVAFTTAGDTLKFTLAKASDHVDFDINGCYRELNELEAAKRNLSVVDLKASGNTWGGRSTIGGSPKDGTKLALETILEIFKENYKS
jgi:hypothetical protein